MTQYSQYKMRLTESESDIHLYLDEETGDLYYYNGQSLIKIRDGSDDDSKKQKDPLGPPDEEDEEEIKKERDELAARGELEEIETDEEQAARLGEIDDLMNDETTMKGLERDSEQAIQNEKRVTAAKRASTRGADTLQEFRLSLEQFVKNQIQEVKANSWKKFNKKYHNSSLIKPGKARTPSGHIPRINVYFDQSASWNENDVRIGEQALASLDKYVDRGEIKIDVYYFSNNVHDNAADARREGGTNAGKVVRHIIESKPDNVIVMTDSDGGRFDSTATVPGAVWFLWKNGSICYELMEHLRGKRLNKSFNLKRGN